MSDQADGLRRMVRSFEGRERSPTLLAAPRPLSRSEPRPSRVAFLRLFPALAARFSRPARRTPEVGSADYSD